MLLRDREVGVDRVDAFDNQQRIAFVVTWSAGIDDVADIDESLTGAAVDGEWIKQ